ncbi:hypothetical protein FRC00_014184 [Tulasnella sp. 408]|nr:hypothetical protein FRC00_014184 [Tulasnella sp. 408]
MRSKQRVAETQNQTFTAIPKSAGRVVSEYELTAALNTRRVVILADEETGNQWVSFSKNDYNLIDEGTLQLELDSWIWRKVGADTKDPQEIERFQSAWLEDGKDSDEDLSELPDNEDKTAANGHYTKKRTAVLSPPPEFNSEVLSPSQSTAVGPIPGSTHLGDNHSTDPDDLQDPGPPPRIRRKIESNQSSSTDEFKLQHRASFGGLPAELSIIIFDLVLAPLGLKSFEYNIQVETMRQVCKHWRNVIDQTKGFWLRITSRCPITINREAIRKSGRDRDQGLPFSIEFVSPPCTSKATSAKIQREFSEFMKLLKPYRSQWEYLDVTLPEQAWKSLKSFIKTQAAGLKALSLGLTQDPKKEVALGNGQPYGELSLFGGDGAALEHVILRCLPICYTPPLHLNLLSLQMSGGIHISIVGLKSFLVNASRLETLELTDVGSSNKPFDSSWENHIMLPRLRRLALQELVHPINIFTFFLSLETPVCQHLHLALALDQEGFPDDFNAAIDALEARIASTAEAVTWSESEVFSHIRLREEGEGHEWWQEGMDDQGQPVGVRLTLRFAEEQDIDPEDSDMATIFCGLVKRVLDRLEPPIRTKVDASNLLRGVGSVLQSHALEGLNLLELSANIVDGHLGRLCNFLTRNDSTRKFPALRILHLLSTEPKHEAEKVVSSSLSLDALIEQLLIQSYGGMDESSLGIILHGKFSMSDKLWQVLEDKGRFKGIAVDYSHATIRGEGGGVVYLEKGSADGVQGSRSDIDRPF